VDASVMGWTVQHFVRVECNNDYITKNARDNLLQAHNIDPMQQQTKRNECLLLNVESK